MKNKALLCYKGIFNINFLKKNGFDSEYIKQIEKTGKNHIEYIYEPLKKQFDLDIVLSTYNLNNQVNETLHNYFKIRDIIFLNFNYIQATTWTAQLLHHLNLLRYIQEKQKVGTEYNFFIFTRLDIEFHKNFLSLPINYNKFNITVEHASGNCDDNFWLFPNNYLNIFFESISELLNSNKMTHELNHEIIKRKGELNYLEKLIESYMGHEMFSFIR